MSASFKRKVKASSISTTGSTGTVGHDGSPSSFTTSSGTVGATSGIALPGTRPWTSGITLTSTGLRELDNILSASGQPLGTCIYLEEDRWTSSLSNCILKYWCAEALSQNQILFCPVSEEESTINDDTSSSWMDNTFRDDDCLYPKTTTTTIHNILFSLPRNLHLDKQDQMQQQQEEKEQQPESAMQLMNIEEGDEEDFEDSNDQVEEELEIAWQYSKTVQQKRSGLGESINANTFTNRKTFCHSYDLSGRLSDQMDVVNKTNIHCIPFTDEKDGYNYFLALVKGIESIIQSNKSQSVIRIMLYHPRNSSAVSVAIPMLITYIRNHKLPVIMMIVVQAWTMNVSSSLPLQRCCDVVLETEGFASRFEYPPPNEFRMLHGLLHIRKVSTITASLGHFADCTITKRPVAFLYGMKRDRRKLHIQLLHIPPEDFSGAGGSVGGGGVRSGAGRGDQQKSSGSMGCATSGGNSTLDF